MSKAKSVLGKDLMLFIDGKAIALATSCKLGLSAETIDTQSKDSGIWTEKDIKKLSWNASSENVFSAVQMRIATINYSLCSWRINLLF